MSAHELKEAAELLFADDAAQTVGPTGDWKTLVRVVLLPARRKKQADWTWLPGGRLRSAEETAVCVRAVIESELQEAGHSARKAVCLQALARWWQLRIGDDHSDPTHWTERWHVWRDELRRLHDVSWDMADRILLHVGGIDVMPLDRGAMRVAARHGWIEPSAEYDEWQSFFIRGLNDANLNVGRFSLQVARVGAAYCGKVPRCDECPLRPLLPAGGPIPLDAAEND
jgi:endonuclease III-like uncharacterized protein